MMSRVSPVIITLTVQDRANLEAVTHKATSPQSDVFRDRIILLAANGLNNTKILIALNFTPKTARKWRDRFDESGYAGLGDVPRSGQPPIYNDTVRAFVTALACELPATQYILLSRLSTTDIHMLAACEINPCLFPSTIAA